MSQERLDWGVDDIQPHYIKGEGPAVEITIYGIEEASVLLVPADAIYAGLLFVEQLATPSLPKIRITLWSSPMFSLNIFKWWEDPEISATIELMNNDDVAGTEAPKAGDWVKVEAEWFFLELLKAMQGTQLLYSK